MFNTFSRMPRFRKRTTRAHNHGGLAVAQTRGGASVTVKAGCGGEPAVVIAERQRKGGSMATDANSGTPGNSMPTSHRDQLLGLSAA